MEQRVLDQQSSSGSELSVGDEPFLNEGMINRQICFEEKSSTLMSS